MQSLKAILRTGVTRLFSPLSVAGQEPPQVTFPEGSGVDVPMLFCGSMPAVEVMVNGKGPFLFAIDTAAQGMARVDSSLLEQLGLQPSGKTQATDGSGRNVRTLDTLRLDSIVIGDAQFSDLTALTRNYNTSPGQPRMDGILGFNLFSAFLLTLDFPAQRVRFEHGELPKPDGAEVLSSRSPRGIPVVEIFVGNSKVNAHIDTGNMVGNFVLPASLVEKLSFASQPITIGRARTVSNEFEIKEARLKESIRVGRYEFTEPTITFPTISKDVNIGCKVFRDFALTFDQKNARLRLVRQNVDVGRATSE
jgi:predicted aspartyl protease